MSCPYRKEYLVNEQEGAGIASRLAAAGLKSGRQFGKVTRQLWDVSGREAVGEFAGALSTTVAEGTISAAERKLKQATAKEKTKKGKSKKGQNGGGKVNNKTGYAQIKPHLIKEARDIADKSKKLGLPVKEQAKTVAEHVGSLKLTGNQAMGLMTSAGMGNSKQRGRGPVNIKKLRGECEVVGQILNKNGQVIGLMCQSGVLIPVKASKKLKDVPVKGQM